METLHAGSLLIECQASEFLLHWLWKLVQQEMQDIGGLGILYVCYVCTSREEWIYLVESHCGSWLLICVVRPTSAPHESGVPACTFQSVYMPETGKHQGGFSDAKPPLTELSVASLR